MYSHLRLYPEVAVYLVRRRISVIHLIRRNLLDIMISLKVKAELGRAHLRVGESAPKDLRISLDAGPL